MLHVCDVISRMGTESGKIYLDYNATTPLAPEVLETITSTLKDLWANPSSAHEEGTRARHCISDARAAVARMISVNPADIIFTSCGTESNNMLFESLVPRASTNSSPPHVIISNLDHPSITLPAHHLQELGLIDLTVVEADPRTARVSPEDVVSALRPSTKLVCLVLANNETGVIQPVREVVRLIRNWEAKGKTRSVFVHTDASQAIGKVLVDAEELGVDYMTIAGHKFYGPRAGALFVRGLDSKTTPLAPLLRGGGQEKGFRSGTENTGMIAGLGKAAELVTEHLASYRDHMETTRDYLEQQLEGNFGSRVHFNGKYENSPRIPNTCNVSIVGEPFRGFEVVCRLKHCLASIGAACHSHGGCKASPVLVACGVPEEVAANALRLSIGRDTSKQDIDVFIQDLKQAVHSLEE